MKDVLEENSNSKCFKKSFICCGGNVSYGIDKARENIAYALYPVLCPLYFVPTSGSPLSFHGELLSTVSLKISTRIYTSYNFESWRCTKYLRLRLLLIHVMPQHCANIIFKGKKIMWTTFRTFEGDSHMTEKASVLLFRRWKVSMSKIMQWDNALTLIRLSRNRISFGSIR